MPNLLIVCDFDGTITLRDTLHVIVERFGTRGLWDSIEPRLRAGEVTLERAMEEEFATVRATPEEVRAVVLRDAGLREGFHDFVDWTRREGHELVVISSGFRSVITVMLAHWGITGLPIVSHEAAFAPEGARLTWGDRGPRCALCDRHCKRHDVARLSAGRTVAYVGDGISDRCAVGLADIVFARAGLADHLTETGAAFTRFEDFHQVRAALRDRRGAAA